MNHKHLALIAAAVIIVAVVLGVTHPSWLPPIARSGADMPNDRQEELSATTTSGEATTPAMGTDSDQAPQGGERNSRLADYPGFGHNIERDEQQFSAEELARENFIAQCMQDNGFDYTPTPSMVVDDAAMNDPAEFERLLTEAAQNPNDAYVSSLSVEMRKAYYMALTGMENPNEEAGQAHDYAENTNSCASQAFRKIPGVYAKRNQLREEFETMEAALEDDKRIIAATEKWSDCMLNKGYRYPRPQDVLRQADLTLAGNYQQGADQKHMESVNAKLETTRKIANTCYQQVDLGEIRQQVRIEYENRFVDQYQTRLTE